MRSEQAQVARWLALLKGVWLAFGGVVESVGVLDLLPGRTFKSAFATDSLEQLRRLHGRDPRGSHLELCTVCCFP